MGAFMPKIVVSPAQAILLLMDKHKENPEVITKLKKWYLSGIELGQHAEFTAMCSALSSGRIEYEVSFSKDVINDDPTKRYFETHLAQRTVQHGIDKIDSAKLESHVKALSRQLDGVRIKAIDRALRGKFQKSDSDLIKEYANYIARIDRGEVFGDLDPTARNKVKQMVQASLLGVASAWHKETLPLNIYGTGIYSAKQKGKVMKEGQESTRNQHMGLLKSHMAVPRSDIAYSDKEVPLMKPSDQATFRRRAAWVEQNFSKLVHPYSNSISGTMLCQLRNLKSFKGSVNDNFTQKPEEFVDFLKVFIGTMVYGSGGHTLYEFSAPLQIDVITEAFSDVSHGKPLTMEGLFFGGNAPAFEQALEETRRYNHQMLRRARVQAEIRLAAKKSTLSAHSEAIKSGLESLKNGYQARVDDQSFNFFRLGHAKSKMISQACSNAMQAIDAHDPIKAQEVLSELKSDFEKKFGRTVTGGGSSEGFKMIEKLEQEIQEMLNDQADEIKPSSISPVP